MKKCDPSAWAKCPDRMCCEFGALISSGSKCDRFNEQMLAQAEPRGMVYDIDFCRGRKDLMRIVDTINCNGWELTALSQNGDSYTVLFRRPA